MTEELTYPHLARLDQLLHLFAVHHNNRIGRAKDLVKDLERDSTIPFGRVGLPGTMLHIDQNWCVVVRRKQSLQIAVGSHCHSIEGIGNSVSPFQGVGFRSYQTVSEEQIGVANGGRHDITKGSF